jgi:hypothetical protein
VPAQRLPAGAWLQAGPPGASQLSPPGSACHAVAALAQTPEGLPEREGSVGEYGEGSISSELAVAHRGQQAILADRLASRSVRLHAVCNDYAGAPESEGIQA